MHRAPSRHRQQRGEQARPRPDGTDGPAAEADSLTMTREGRQAVIRGEQGLLTWVRIRGSALTWEGRQQTHWEEVQGALAL